MRNTKPTIMIAIVLSFLAKVDSTWAQGTGSHGGDARCQEFFKIASDLSSDLVKIGQAEVSEVSASVDVNKISAQVTKPLVVIPSGYLPRQALSNPDLDQTELYTDAWDTLDKLQKIKLVTHELMVLGGAEVDGEYAISANIDKLLATKNFIPSLDAEAKLVGYTYTFNDDYSINITNLGWGNDDKFDPKTPADGVCNFFGFKQSVNFQITTVGLGFEYSTSVLNKDGSFKKAIQHRPSIFNLSDPNTYAQVYSSITCK